MQTNITYDEKHEKKSIIKYKLRVVLQQNNFFENDILVATKGGEK